MKVSDFGSGRNERFWRYFHDSFQKEQREKKKKKKKGEREKVDRRERG